MPDTPPTIAARIREAAAILGRLETLTAALSVAHQQRASAQIEVRGIGWHAAAIPVEAAMEILFAERAKCRAELARVMRAIRGRHV